MEGTMVNGAVSGAGSVAGVAPSQRGAQWAARVRGEVQKAVVGQDASSSARWWRCSPTGTC